MRILKFGGKSLSNVNKIKNICKFIKKIYADEKNIIIVVSAMGETTDNLNTLASKFNYTDESKRELAVLLSTGEIQSASLFSIMLNSFGVPAKSLQAFQIQMKTFGDPLCSRITSINKTEILKCFKENKVAVITGFQGINSDGEITTLGRGGSDTTATALGASFDTSVEIYSDYNGVFSGDPKILNFKKLKSIDYNTMISMALGGAKVLDYRATQIAKEHNIKIFAKSSYEPNKSGTIVSNIESSVLTISSIDHLAKITITFSNKENIHNITKNVINSLIGINFHNLSINSNTLTFFISQTDKTKTIKAISTKLKLIKSE